MTLLSNNISPNPHYKSTRCKSLDGSSNLAYKLSKSLNFSSCATQAHIIDKSVEDYIKKSKKAANYMKQLIHSESCSGRCGLPTCVQISSILSHSKNCLNNNCKVPGCATSKNLWNHYLNCRDYRNPSISSRCLICSLAFSGSPTRLRSQSLHSIKTLEEDRHDSNVNQDDSLDSSLDNDSEYFINDEIIESNRVPFQTMSCNHSTRTKTYSDSHFLIRSESDVSDINKIRSKSLNILQGEHLV